MSSSPTETTLVDVTMPQMGVSVAEGTLVEWRKAVGDAVEADETVCEVSTDKIDTEVPAPAGGTVAEVLVEVGATVPVGTALARIAPVGAEGNGSAPERRPPRRYSPVVTRIAAEHGIDLATVEGTGRDGRVRKQDVLALVHASDPPLHTESPYRPEPEAEPAPAPAATGTGTLSRMRRQIGEHMKRSLDTAATCTSWIEVDFHRVEADRVRTGLTALAYVARATVRALEAFPALNATLEGEAYTRHEAVHLGIAVSLGEEGLVVPVVRDAQELTAAGLAKRIRELARRARAGELSPDDVRGGTFTITNPGQYGTLMATPVINQPQVAILASRPSSSGRWSSARTRSRCGPSACSACRGTTARWTARSRRGSSRRCASTSRGRGPGTDPRAARR